MEGLTVVHDKIANEEKIFLRRFFGFLRSSLLPYRLLVHYITKEIHKHEVKVSTPNPAFVVFLRPVLASIFSRIAHILLKITAAGNGGGGPGPAVGPGRAGSLEMKLTQTLVTGAVHWQVSDSDSNGRLGFGADSDSESSSHVKSRCHIFTVMQIFLGYGGPETGKS